MPSFTSTYVKPDVYFKISNVPAPLAPGGDFIPIMVGLGRKELDVIDVLTRDVAVDTQDILTTTDIINKVYKIVDENQVPYNVGTDFKLVRGSTVTDSETYYIDWNQPQSMTGTQNLDSVVLTGLTLKINVTNSVGHFEGTITFTAAETSPTTICTLINSTSSLSIAAPDISGDYIVLSGDSVTIEGGSALQLLGFLNGQQVISNEPADGVNYTVYYNRDKNASEYTQEIFTKLEDVYADQGAPQQPTKLLTEASGAGITITPVANNTKLSTLADTNANFSNVAPGNYIKITSGTGAGQIRVISEVTSSTAIVVSNFTENPDVTSMYTITDIGYNQTSFGCYFANLGGAQQFITSQVPDDIVNDANWRGAISDTFENVQGQQGFTLVPLRGMNLGDSLISYIISYLTNANSTVGNKERSALFGIPMTGMTATQVVQLLNSITNSTIGVSINPYIKQNGMTFGSEYLAAYIAGTYCNPNYDEGEPISGKPVNVDYVDDPWITYEKRLFGQNGGIVTEQQGASYKIVHFLSTDTTDIISSELKVWKQTCGIKKAIRNTVQTAIVNTRALPIAVPRAQSIVKMILDNKVNLTAINNYKNLSIAFDSDAVPNGDPRQLDISFLYKPTFDIDWVYVQFGATIS